MGKVSCYDAPPLSIGDRIMIPNDPRLNRVELEQHTHQ